MAAGRPRLGLSELNLGVPVPGHSLRMLRSRLSSPAVDDLVFRGEGCTAARARELGIIHRTAATADTLAVTELELGTLAVRPRRAFVESKRFLFGEVWEAMRRGSPEEDAAFLDCWFEDEKTGTYRRDGKSPRSLKGNGVDSPDHPCGGSGATDRPSVGRRRTATAPWRLCSTEAGFTAPPSAPGFS